MNKYTKLLSNRRFNLLNKLLNKVGNIPITVRNEWSIEGGRYFFTRDKTPVRIEVSDNLTIDHYWSTVLHELGHAIHPNGTNFNRSWDGGHCYDHTVLQAEAYAWEMAISFDPAFFEGYIMEDAHTWFHTYYCMVSSSERDMAVSDWFIDAHRKWATTRDMWYLTA